MPAPMRYELVEELPDGRRRVRYVEGPLAGRTVVFHVPRQAARPVRTRRQSTEFAAERRARSLLWSLLTDAQRADWAAHHRFEVETEHGTVELGRLHAMPFRPRHLDGELELCVVPQGNDDLPEDDVWANLLLSLRSDPRTFLTVANWRRPGGSWHRGPVPGLLLDPVALS